MERPRRSEYTPRDFAAFEAADTLEITPKFQRRSVWQTPKRSFFIDSLLRDMPVPPVYLRETQSADFKRMIRQVIDGQQRIRAVLEFMEGRFALSRSLDGPWAGKTFDKLLGPEQDRIRNYHFAAEVFVDIGDAEVLDIFSRMNSYAVPLNRQELRNGKYFGHFKQACYALGHEHLEFWRKHRMFTEQAIARMLEVELTSELLIQGIDGLQDKKASIDDYYANCDESFPDRTTQIRRFRAVFDAISKAFDDSLADTDFRRGPLFYTLYGVVFHRLFGLPHQPKPRALGAVPDAELFALAQAASKLTDLIVAFREDEAVPTKYASFVAACLQQTDNIQPRQTRLTTLWREWRALAD